MADRSGAPAGDGRTFAGPRPLRSFRHGVAETMLAQAAVEDGETLRSDVVAFVDERISSMPAHLRLGIIGTEFVLLLSSVGSVAHRKAVSARRLRRWETSRLPPVTQYVRAIRSLVLLAAHEFAEVRKGSDRW